MSNNSITISINVYYYIFGKNVDIFIFDIIYSLIIVASWYNDSTSIGIQQSVNDISCHQYILLNRIVFECIYVSMNTIFFRFGGQCML